MIPTRVPPFNSTILAMASNPTFAQRAQLASETRKRFVADAGRAMVEVSAAVQERLLALMSEAAPMREMQVRRDA